MAIDLRGDIAAMIKDMPGSVQVFSGSQSTWGLWDEETGLQTLGGGQLQVAGENLSVTILTGSLDVKKCSPLTVEGKTYQVRFAQRRDDGALTTLWLEEP
jgi:hypothetical protein